MILGVILARGGSKRLPGKNLRPFNGVPLVRHTLLQAQAARTLDGITLSSDDHEILKQAAKIRDRWGGIVQLVHRPPKLADNDATSYAAINHAVGQRYGLTPTHVCLLQPTSPNRTSWDIDATVALCVAHDHPTYTATIGVFPIRPNGAVYVDTVASLRLGHNWDNAQIATCHFMPPERSHDIDTLADFEAAERDAA